MATVYDVASYILESRGEMTAMKLQKLCYYSHAWHLVWDEEPLFHEAIEAWANGPVVRALYNAHRGEFRLSSLPPQYERDVQALAENERETVDAVLQFYGDLGAHQLSELTHSERPWQNARQGLKPGERGATQITDSEIAAYYDSLTAASAN